MSTVPEHLDKIDKLSVPIKQEMLTMHAEGHFIDDVVLTEITNIELAIQDARQKMSQKIKENPNE